MLTPDGRPTGLVTSTASSEWLSQNIQGSVATTTTSTGTSKCQLQYDPYGALLFSLTPTNVCESGSTTSDLLYNSDRRDPTTGTYQLGARNYDPTKNGFLEPDGFASGQPAQDLQLQSDPLTRNVYGYVNGDPVNYFDPTGHNPCAYEEGGCTSVMNKALAASDRGADISGVSSHTTTRRTFHSPVYRSYTAPERHLIAANGSGADVAQAAWLARQAAAAQARANSSQIQAQIQAQDQAGQHGGSGGWFGNALAWAWNNKLASAGIIAGVAIAATAAVACIAATVGVCALVGGGAAGAGAGAATTVIGDTEAVTPAAEDAAGGAAEMAGPDLASLPAKITGQMARRGWTSDQIQKAFDNGERINAINKATGGAATRYINPESGQSVVIDNSTGAVIHVGGAGFQYGPDSGDAP